MPFKQAQWNQTRSILYNVGHIQMHIFILKLHHSYISDQHQRIYIYILVRLQQIWEAVVSQLWVQECVSDRCRALRVKQACRILQGDTEGKTEACKLMTNTLKKNKKTLSCLWPVWPRRLHVATVCFSFVTKSRFYRKFCERIWIWPFFLSFSWS